MSNANEVFSSLIRRVEQTSVRSRLEVLAAEIEGSEIAQIQASSITNTIISYEGMIENMRELISMMQKEIDQKVEMEIQRLKMEITAIGPADHALSYYGTVWFSNLLYSQQGLQRIANTLLDLTAPYFPPNLFWTRIVSGNFTDLEATNGDPTVNAKLKRFSDASIF